MLTTIKNFLIDIFFPKFCFNCSKEGNWLCEDCKSLLNVLEHQYCLCKKPRRVSSAKKCKKCKSKNLSGLYCALNYQEKPLTKKLILQFKYKPFIKTLNETFADLIIKHIYLSENHPNEIFKDSLVIPVPLIKKKLKYRGFNQSLEIAESLSKRTPLKKEFNNLIKIKNTPSQTELSSEQRKENVKNSFTCKNPERIKNRKIFLVDDVYTTGSTLEEASKTLKKAGAKKVWGIVIAREE